MQKSKWVMMLSLMLALLISVPVFAQDITDITDVVFCGDLAEADCAFLQQSTLANGSISSAASQFNVDIVIENVPDLPFENLAFNLNGNTSFSVAEALIAEMSALQNFSDPNAVMTYFQDPEVVKTLIGGVNGQLSLNLTLPQDLVDMFAGSSATIPSQISLELRLVDGVGYINLDGVASAMPQMGVPGGWLGFDIARALELAIEQGAFDDLSIDDVNTSMDMDYEAIAEYITIERLADSTVNGKAVAVFETVIDYAALFNSDVMTQQMQAQGNLTEAELAEAQAVAQAMGEGIDFSTTQYIGLDDYYVYRTEGVMNWDMTSLMESVGETTPSGQAPTFIFTFEMTASDFNSAPVTVAPDGAQMYPVEAMFSNS